MRHFMHCRLQIPIRLTMSALVLSPFAAWAAGTATIESRSADGPGMVTIMWQDDGAVRIDAEAQGPKSYMIARDGKLYSVFNEGGSPRVMEVSGMLKAFGAMAGSGQGAGQAIPARIESLKATGASETVAGIEGRVYRITAIDADGTRDTRDAVLSGDPRVTEMTRAYLGAMLSLMGHADPDDVLHALPDGKKGLLRYGDDYYLSAISAEAPAAAQFELPAKPVDLADMMKGLGQQPR